MSRNVVINIGILQTLVKLVVNYIMKIQTACDDLKAKKALYEQNQYLVLV